MVAGNAPPTKRLEVHGIAFFCKVSQVMQDWCLSALILLPAGGGCLSHKLWPTATSCLSSEPTPASTAWAEEQRQYPFFLLGEATCLAVRHTPGDPRPQKAHQEEWAGLGAEDELGVHSRMAEADMAAHWEE